MGSTGRYVIYTRVSKDPDGTSSSPAAQHDECLALAQARGWPEPDHLSDVDTSAWSRNIHRPAWEQVIDGIHAGAIDGLIVHHLDRMLRQVRDLEALIDAIEARTRGKFPVHSVHGTLDLSTPDGRFQARILTSVAQKESDDKSRRLKLVLGKNAREGRGHGGIAPYGWQSDRVTVDPVEKETLDFLISEVLAGQSLQQLARLLNSQGTPTRKKQGRWHATTIKQILTSPRLAGLRTHHGRVVATGDWEPIVTPDVHEQLVRLLTRPTPGYHTTALRYWLTGVLECGVCGRTLRSRHEGGKQRRYVCRRDKEGCGLGIDAAGVEDVFAGIIMGLIRDHDIRAQVEGDDERVVKEELAAAEHRLKQLSRDFYSDRVITEIEFRAARLPLADRVADLEARLRVVVSPKHSFDVPAWDDLNPADRADLCREIIERAVIHAAVPGRRFDPSRIEVWLRG